MKLGENDIKLYLGSAEISKIMLGTEQVYPSEEPTHDAGGIQGGGGDIDPGYGGGPDDGGGE